MITSEIDKYKIRSSFSKAALKYDIFASLQKEAADELIDFVFKIPHPTSLIPHPRILDIGCGTGFLTHGLARLLSKANIFGCDIAHEMTEQATCKVKSAKYKKHTSLLPMAAYCLTRIKPLTWLHQISLTNGFMI